METATPPNQDPSGLPKLAEFEDQGFDFLGFRYFRNAKDGKLLKLAEFAKIVRGKSVKRFRERVREETPRHPQQRPPKAKRLTVSRLRKNHRVREMIREVNAYLKGWHWHFKHIRTSWDILEGLDGFVRRRVRSAICGRYAKGRWNVLLNNDLLRQLGLLSLKDLQRQYQLRLLKAPHTSCVRGGSRMR
jgi:hypothetical protein